MSEKEKQATTQKLMGQEQALQQMQASFQQEYTAARDKQTKQVNTLLEKIKGIVNKIATRDKYDLIMVNASVAYANPSMDITQAVLAEMKK
jgi:Skp family chaperone for outer membrane proteins